MDFGGNTHNCKTNFGLGFSPPPGQWHSLKGERSVPTSQEQGGKVYEISDKGVVPPKVLTQTIPSYTEEARLGGVEGDVVLRCIIRTTGRVTDCQVVQSPGSGLAEVSIKEIQDNWRFSPATVDGKPVDLRAKIELTFNLRLRDGELPVSEAEGLAIERVELIGLKEEPAASVRALLQMQESSRFQKSAFESDVNRLREKFKSVSWEVSKGSSGGVVVKYRFDRR